MGNMICCQEQHKQLSQPVNVVRKEEPIQLPELSDPIMKNLDKEKPFYKQLPVRPTVKKFGEDVYEGKIDQRGRPYGYGKMYHKNGSLFVGEFKNGIANGNGHYIRPNGAYYHGKMVENKANDEDGYYWSPDFQYRGGVVDNKFSGRGTETGPQHSFTGEYHDGERVKGILKWNENGERNEYEGGFNEQGKFEGKGRLKQENNGEYVGDFVNGLKHGHGEYTFNNGKKYIGEYYRGVKEGRGKIIRKNGMVAYNGEWKNGLPHGKGVAPTKNGELQERDWIEGLDKTQLDEEF